VGSQGFPELEMLLGEAELPPEIVRRLCSCLFNDYEDLVPARQAPAKPRQIVIEAAASGPPWAPRDCRV